MKLVLGLMMAVVAVASGCAKLPDGKVKVEAKPQPEEQLVGYWVLDSAEPGEESAEEKQLFVAGDAIKFSARDLQGARLYIVELCGRESLRSQGRNFSASGFYALEGNLLKTGIINEAIPVLDASTESFERVNKAKRYSPTISEITSSSFLLDGKYRYRKFQPEAELSNNGKGAANLCESAKK